MASPTIDNPNVKFPPPLIYIIGFVLGIFLQKWVPLPDGFFRYGITGVIGLAVLVIGGYIVGTAASEFIKAKTQIFPTRPATTLVADGLFKYSRNPMYLGFAILYLGLCLMSGNWWQMILLVVSILLIQELVIKREEAYLTRKFGESYLTYKARVRRWV